MPKQKDFFDSTEGFLRLSHFSVFINMNKLLDSASDIFWMKSSNDTFIAFQIKAFGTKNSIYMHRLKSAILAFFLKSAEYLDWPCPVSAALQNSSQDSFLFYIRY